MIRYLLALCLFATPCLAQDAPPAPSAQQRVESIIGSLVVQNADLAARVDTLTRQVQDLGKQLADERAKQKSQ
jgi:cell division protein FtsB